ncbi:unnamed protein product [Lampetra fluviatilis]
MSSDPVAESWCSTQWQQQKQQEQRQFKQQKLQQRHLQVEQHKLQLLQKHKLDQQKVHVREQQLEFQMQLQLKQQQPEQLQQQQQQAQFQDLDQEQQQDLELADTVRQGEALAVEDAEMEDEPIQMWDYKSTMLLLEGYTCLKESFRSNQYRKKGLWEKLTDRLHLQGLQFQAKQVQGRWKTLLAAYRKALVDKQRVGGPGWHVCTYFREMRSILVDDGALAAERTTGGGEVAHGADILHPAACTTARGTTASLRRRNKRRRIVDT